MKQVFFLFTLLISVHAFALENDASDTTKQMPDTVKVGIYITSLHNIDFKAKEYTINLWLWLKYKRPEFDFSKNLEVPMAKTFEKSYYSVDTLEDGSIYMLMKLQCIMKDSWKIKYFPFDYQKLRFSIENSEYDASDLVFAEDTAGEHYSKWTSTAWKILPDSFKISTGIKKYETAFGDPEALKPDSEFGVFRVTMGLERDSWELFLKLFLGMYLSFMISYVCFYIHADSIESRFGLSVGSLFAVIGNKYIIDSSLPESTSFTLVDSLHGLTLAFIFGVVACSIHSLRLAKKDRLDQANRFDFIAAQILLVVYLTCNIYFIYTAYNA
jgi:hypothetical protein